MATTTTPSAAVRLDWLRVLAIAAVFLFHSALRPTGLAVKNPTTYPALKSLPRW
ncbi:hypothetical protein [Candidatus Amarolinea aalborgensis]|uniref:hypothetical protein n=1 Tax=Candidatus Amarolinea aalborgensis TaxID=2249329 RepID=UPI003BF9AE23